MTATTVPTTPPTPLPTPLPITGEATYYGKGVFEKVVSNRIRWGQIELNSCPHCQGYVAMLRPVDMGRKVCVRIHKRIWGPYLVVDVATDHDRANLISRGWVLDVQWEVWFEQWKQPRRPINVTVVECLKGSRQKRLPKLLF